MVRGWRAAGDQIKKIKVVVSDALVAYCLRASTVTVCGEHSIHGISCRDTEATSNSLVTSSAGLCYERRCSGVAKVRINGRAGNPIDELEQAETPSRGLSRSREFVSGRTEQRATELGLRPRSMGTPVDLFRRTDTTTNYIYSDRRQKRLLREELRAARRPFG